MDHVYANSIDKVSIEQSISENNDNYRPFSFMIITGILSLVIILYVADLASMSELASIVINFGDFFIGVIGFINRILGDMNPEDNSLLDTTYGLLRWLLSS